MTDQASIANHVQRAEWSIEGAENQIKHQNWLGAQEALRDAVSSLEEAKMWGQAESIEATYTCIKALNGEFPTWAQMSLK